LQKSGHFLPFHSFETSTNMPWRMECNLRSKILSKTGSQDSRRKHGKVHQRQARISVPKDHQPRHGDLRKCHSSQHNQNHKRSGLQVGREGSIIILITRSGEFARASRDMLERQVWALSESLFSVFVMTLIIGCPATSPLSDLEEDCAISSPPRAFLDPLYGCGRNEV
jgi:hypothetical protein